MVMDMPTKGYKSITIREKWYKILDEKAQQENRSISSIVEELVKNFIQKGEIPRNE